MKLGYREGKGECLVGALFMTSWHSPVEPELFSLLGLSQVFTSVLGLESYNQQTLRKIEQQLPG